MNCLRVLTHSLCQKRTTETSSLGLFIKTFTSSPRPSLSTPWLPHCIYFSNILTLTSASIKRPISNDKSLLTYFWLTSLIYLTIMLISCILTTCVVPINENTIQSENIPFLIHKNQTTTYFKLNICTGPWSVESDCKQCLHPVSLHNPQRETSL